MEGEVSWSCYQLMIELWVETPTTGGRAGCWKKVCGGEEGVCSGHSLCQGGWLVVVSAALGSVEIVVVEDTTKEEVKWLRSRKRE